MLYVQLCALWKVAKLECTIRLVILALHLPSIVFKLANLRRDIRKPWNEHQAHSHIVSVIGSACVFIP